MAELNPDISSILSDEAHDFLSSQLNASFSPYPTPKPHPFASTSTAQHQQPTHSTGSSDTGSDHRGLLNFGVPAIVNGKRTSQAIFKNTRPQSVRKACELCNAAKQKCSGDQPRCERCAASHWDCIYTFRVRRAAPKKIPNAVPPPRPAVLGNQPTTALPNGWTVPSRSSGMTAGYPTNQKAPERRTADIQNDNGQRPTKRRRIRSSDKDGETRIIKERPLLSAEEYLQFIKDDGLITVDDLFVNINTLGPLPPPPPSPSPSPPPTDFPLAQSNYPDSLINPAALLAALDAIARSADLGDPTSHSAALDQRSVQILAQMLDGRLNDGFVDLGTQNGSVDGYAQEPQEEEVVMETTDPAVGAFDRTAAVHSALHEALRNAQRSQQDHVETMDAGGGQSGQHRQEVDEEHQHFARFTNHVTDDSDHEVQVAGRRGGHIEEDMRSMEEVMAQGLPGLPSVMMAGQDNSNGFLPGQDYAAQMAQVETSAGGVYSQPAREKDEIKVDELKSCSHIQQLSDIMRLFFDLKFLASPTLEAVFGSAGPGITLAKDIPHCVSCASMPSNTIPILALLSRLCITIAKPHPHTPHPLPLVVAGTQIMGTEIAPEIETHMIDIIWEQWRFRYAHQIIDVLESRAAAQLALARIASGEGRDSTTNGGTDTVMSISVSPRCSGEHGEDFDATKAVVLETANRTLLDALPRLRSHLSQSGNNTKR